jgi:hypothetical protein
MPVAFSNLRSGGVLSDANAVIKASRFQMFDYGGKSAGGPVPAMHFTMEDEDGGPHEQYYTFGKASDWQISPDGMTVEGPGFHKKSNFGRFLEALYDACESSGIGTSWITDRADCFVGLDAHWVTLSVDTQSGQKDVPVIDRINAIPGGKKTGGAGASDEVKKTAKEVVHKILVNSGGKIPKAQLYSRVYRDMGTNPLKQDVSNLINAQWLAENFTVSAGIVSEKQ